MNRIERNHIVELVSQYITGDGYECIEAEWVSGSAGDPGVLRLFVENINGKTVDVNHCAAVSRLLSECDELDERFSQPYSLEVSSPGVERPLRLRCHFDAVRGREVKVKLTRAIGDRKNAKGEVVSISPDGKVTIKTDRGDWTFPIEDLDRAKVVHDWDA